ncbi:MAG: site-2 protease family protein [Elusimicrobia bacterium]|nr:site-2 protease family protein [Elusimicrobiota bacterium]
MDWIIQLPILFFSVIIHEISHGLMAFYKGDDTASLSGRITLNPIPHVDPVGTILFPVLCILGHAPVFGWAKPVPVNPNRLDSPRADMVKVAFIGPLSNIALAAAAAVFFRMNYAQYVLPVDLKLLLANVFRFAVILNLYLAFFNLIPVFPLDGSKVLSGILPEHWSQAYEAHAPYGFIILIFLMMTGMLSMFIVPPVEMMMSVFQGLGLM